MDAKKKGSSAASINLSKLKLQEAKRVHNQLVRRFTSEAENARDRNLDGIITGNSNCTFKTIKAHTKTSSSKVRKIKVGDKTYFDDHVPDGIFESIKILKTEPTLSPDPSHPDFSEVYRHILDICKSGRSIPSISEEKSLKILQKMRKNVNDFFSITALHYLNAGKSDLNHFHFLLNASSLMSILPTFPN